MFKPYLAVISFFFLLIFNQMVVADTSFCRTDLDKMVQEIKLEDSQKAKIQSIIDRLKSDLKSTGSKIALIDTQIKQQVNSGNKDQHPINSLVDQKANLIGDMMKAKLSAQNQVLSILNPQQRDKLQNLLNQEDEKMAQIYSKCSQE